MNLDTDSCGGSVDSDAARRLQHVMDRLLREYSGRLAAGTIVSCVAGSTRAAAQLDLETPEDLAWVVENLARSRLGARLGVIDLDDVVQLPARRGAAPRTLVRRPVP